MAHVYYSKVLEVAPDRAWAIIRDFGSLPVWFPFVKASVLRAGGPHEAGAIRTNTVADGSIIEERLLEISDRDRRIVYDIIAADNIPTKHYSSTLRLHEVTAAPDRCFAEWSADFDVEGDRESTLSWVRDGIFKTCLEELERVLRHDAPAEPHNDPAQAVREVFDKWSAAQGSLFDLMADDAIIEIPGIAPHCGTFSKADFVRDVAMPFMARFSTPPVPIPRKIWSDGEDVTVLADAKGTTRNGKPYANSYVFVLRMRDGRIVRATEFLDMAAFNAVWDDVEPVAQPGISAGSAR